MAAAAATSASAPIHTNDESVVPWAKKNAANASAPPVAATTAPAVDRRSTRARTGEDASIAKTPPTARSQTVYIVVTPRTPPLERLTSEGPQRTFDPSAIGARETRMLTRRSIRKTGLAAAVVVSALALVAAGAPAASAAPAATATATNNCWLQVVNDWLAHGQVTGLYPIPCYTQAIQHLSAYPDIKQYSSAIDDIHRALLAAIHEERGNGPGGSLGLGGGGGSGASRRRRRRRRRRDGRPRQEPLQPACGRHRPGERAVHSAPAARARRPRTSPVFDSCGDVVRPAPPGPADHPRACSRARG